MFNRDNTLHNFDLIFWTTLLVTSTFFLSISTAALPRPLLPPQVPAVAFALELVEHARLQRPRLVEIVMPRIEQVGVRVVGNKLELVDAGERTQEVQDDIVAMLDELIKQAEDSPP